MAVSDERKFRKDLDKKKPVPATVLAISLISVYQMYRGYTHHANEGHSVKARLYLRSVNGDEIDKLETKSIHDYLLSFW